MFGLKWRDVDFQHGELSVVRSIVFGVVGRCKTESSQKPVPLHPLLREELLNWRKTCNYNTAPSVAATPAPSEASTKSASTSEPVAETRTEAH